MKRHLVLRRIRIFLSLCCVIAFVAGCIAQDHIEKANPSGGSIGGASVAYAAAIFLGALWFFPAVLAAGFGVGDALYEAEQSYVPSPAQIASMIEQEQGSPATYQDVAAVQQILTTEHNQKLLRAGVGVAAIVGFHELNKH